MKAINFVEKQRTWLHARLQSKTQILKNGGEQALSHSTADISRISFALKRIETGEYGLCTSCGCVIEEGRLNTIPETPFCAECAIDIESQ